MLRSVFAAFAACALVACGSSDSPGPPAAPATATSLIDAQCAALDSCCALAGVANDVTACQGLYGATPITPSARTAACETALRSATADGSFCVSGTVANGVDPCDGVFSGGASALDKVGDACDKNNDCVPTTAGAVGYCDPREGLDTSSGAPDTTKQCVDQLPGVVGSGPCELTIDIDGSSVSTADPTSPVPALLYACSRANGLFCDATSHACVAAVAPGGACPTADRCDPALGVCDFTTQLCVAYLAIGAACTDGAAPGCVPNAAACRSGVCTAVAAGGAPCTAPTDCASAQCENGVCKAAFARPTSCISG